jgi:hypothetical protein
MEALATDTPDARASALISGSKLADPKVRMSLFEGGKKLWTPAKTR